MISRSLFSGLALCVALAATGCGEPGQARATDKELAGVYETGFASGKERLTLNPDHTFTDVFPLPAGPMTTKGTWKSSDNFLGPTEVELEGPFILEDRPSAPPAYGLRNLMVHREQGKLRLAANETADWYYDRVQ